MVGSGAVARFLEAGARVVVVARTEQKLKDLLNKFAPRSSQLIGVVGEFNSRAEVEEIRSVIKAALNGESVNHVVSTIGFIDVPQHGITSGDLGALKKCLDDSLFPTILCGQVFMEDLKDKPGSTYTIVTGGFAHKCYAPNLWVGTIKNAALNGVVESFICDTKDSAVRVNGNCFHYGICRPGEDKNQLGLGADVTNLETGQTFIRIIERKDLKGEIIHHDVREDTERFLGTPMLAKGTAQT